MPLPEPNLDDLRFQQDIVDEARRRIIRYCPEWTDYNLSDPGITLIELFAWMTEMMVYRLNRVPEKNYIKFMELLGIHLQPASSARTELTFRLSAPFPLGSEDDTAAVVPRGTEIATRQIENDPEIIFTTDERIEIVPPVLTQLRREQDFHKNYLPRLGIEDCSVFNRRPQEGDTFYLGFDESEQISGQILRLQFLCEQTQATGVRREDPPLVWECSVGDGRWEVLPLSKHPDEKDTTGGLNNEEGRLVLYLPLAMQPDTVHGRRAYWIRCRIHQRHRAQGMYTESPRIKEITVFALGGSVPATHAVFVRDEVIGTSTGEPGQRFSLENAPVLDLTDEEYIEIEEKREGDLHFVRWDRVDDFSGSSRHDRHFMIDTATGEISFGPAVRQPDGTVRQYGRVPEAGRRIRMSQYRYGGGTVGNVPTGKLEILRTAIPYVDSVSNLQRAEGGRDPETLAEAKRRAARELRAQNRAVTAEDYENLAHRATREVQRIKCLAPCSGSNAPPPGTIELLVVPAVAGSLRFGDLSKLHVDSTLARTVRGHLDQYRLLTTTLLVREPSYLGVRVRAEIVPSEYSQPEVVKARVADGLRRFLCPVALEPEEEILGQEEDIFGPNWQGWPFGRDLYLSEVYSLIQKIPGVKYVCDVHFSHRPVIPREEALPLEDGETEEQEERLVPVEGKRIELPDDTLLCSLVHEIELVDEWQ